MATTALMLVATPTIRVLQANCLTIIHHHSGFQPIIFNHSLLLIPRKSDALGTVQKLECLKGVWFQREKESVFYGSIVLLGCWGWAKEEKAKRFINTPSPNFLSSPLHKHVYDVGWCPFDKS
jgi:hypothetical protein